MNYRGMPKSGPKPEPSTYRSGGNGAISDSPRFLRLRWAFKMLLKRFTATKCASTERRAKVSVAEKILEIAEKNQAVD